MILPDDNGKAWAASGRVADMWLTLVLAFVRGTPSKRPPLIMRPRPPKCCVCGGAPCRTPITCAGRRLDGLG